MLIPQNELNHQGAHHSTTKMCFQRFPKHLNIFNWNNMLIHLQYTPFNALPLEKVYEQVLREKSCLGFAKSYLIWPIFTDIVFSLLLFFSFFHHWRNGFPAYRVVLWPIRARILFDLFYKHCSKRPNARFKFHLC